MNLQRLADIIVASWVVSQGKRKLPAAQGVLDRALREAVSRGAFPGAFQELRFNETAFGVYSPELEAALDWANSALLTSSPNPSYESAEINLSREAAIAILDEYGVSIENATAWGQELAAALERSGGRR